MHLEYFSFGQSKSLNLNTIKSAGTTGPAFAMAVSPGSAPAKKAAGNSLPDLKAIESLGAIKGGHPNSQVAWHELNISDARYMVATDGTFMVVTDSIMVEGIRKTDLKRLRDDLGFEVVREGEQGRLLLRAPVTENAAFSLMQKALDHLKTVKAIKAAHPHFIRTIFTPKPSAAGGMPLWNHNNTGNPGVAGADVAALAAWTITKGNPEIRVAVLDEGVDSKHPNLRKRIVAELDVVGGNSHARPNGNDAHGTACAGIIASQSKTYPGLAPDCSLIGVRIAKGNGNDGWIIDDFDTADAIEWSWKEGKADVLSNIVRSRMDRAGTQPICKAMPRKPDIPMAKAIGMRRINSTNSKRKIRERVIARPVSCCLDKKIRRGYANPRRIKACYWLASTF